MFYGQCNDCGQRWELGTARTCTCKDEHMRDTIDMAREAGWKDLRDYDSEMRNDFFMGNTDSLKAFEALVRADERARLQPKKIKASKDDYCQGDERYYANE